MKPTHCTLALSLMLSLALASQVSLAQPQAGQNGAATAQASTQASDFTRGNHAYKAGDYSVALQWFERALAAGNQQATLIYNHAVTLYKLQRYDAASASFMRLLNTPQWQDLARYNLGLVALAQGDHNSASRWFRLVENTSNPRLQQLAQQQLARLPIAKNPNTEKKPQVAAPSAAKKSTLFFSLGAAADDNASGLADELVGSSSHAQDTYLNALAYGQTYVSGNKNNGIKIYGLGQLRRYQRFDHFNSQVLGLGGNWETRRNEWNLELGGRLLQTHINGAQLANQYSLLTKASKPVGSAKLELSHTSSFYAASAAYDQIGGWQHQLKAAMHYQMGALRFSPGVRGELNERHDRRTDKTFYSYSPQVLGLTADAQWDITKQWRLMGNLDWSKATYGEQNQHADLDGNMKQQARANRRLQTTLGLGYKLAPNWLIKTQYLHNNSQDTFALYTQSKNVYSLNLDFIW